MKINITRILLVVSCILMVCAFIFGVIQRINTGRMESREEALYDSLAVYRYRAFVLEGQLDELQNRYYGLTVKDSILSADLSAKERYINYLKIKHDEEIAGLLSVSVDSQYINLVGWLRTR